MKPHEETWRVEQDGGLNQSMPYRITRPEERITKTSARQPYHLLADTLERARLAAQAPAMAREWLEMLKGLEYCPRCGVSDDAPKRHLDRCSLATVLRAAGVIE